MKAGGKCFTNKINKIWKFMLIGSDFIVFFIEVSFQFRTVLHRVFEFTRVEYCVPHVLICAVKFGCCTTDGVVCVGKLTARCCEK